MFWYGVVVVSWLMTNPAEPLDRSATIYRGEFPTLKACEERLSVLEKRAIKDYGKAPVVISTGCRLIK